jgi:hypothetical protein
MVDYIPTIISADRPNIFSPFRIPPYAASIPLAAIVTSAD